MYATPLVQPPLEHGAPCISYPAHDLTRLVLRSLEITKSAWTRNGRSQGRRRLGTPVPGSLSVLMSDRHPQSQSDGLQNLEHRRKPPFRIDEESGAACPIPYRPCLLDQGIQRSQMKNDGRSKASWTLFPRLVRIYIVTYCVVGILASSRCWWLGPSRTLSTRLDVGSLYARVHTGPVKPSRYMWRTHVCLRIARVRRTAFPPLAREISIVEGRVDCVRCSTLDQTQLGLPFGLVIELLRL